jgi:hypothetical protein
MNDIVPPESRRRRWIAAAILALMAAGAALWLYLRTPGTEPPPSAPVAAAPSTPPPATARPLCAMSDAAPAPPRDGSDEAVAPLVRALSSHPRVIAWIATDGLVRNFTVAVENIANGQVPLRALQALRPSGPFRVREVNEALLVDPRGYSRYAPVAAAVGSVDAQAAARLCAALKPRLEEAYAELGRTEPFDLMLERAILTLLGTPLPFGDIRLVSAGAVYDYEDETLQRLNPAQRQLLRLGPDNMRIVQDKLRQIALAIGLPPERLGP